MSQGNTLKLKDLRKTKNFYIWELKREESLTENVKFKYLRALEIIERIIKEKEDCEGRGKTK